MKTIAACLLILACHVSSLPAAGKSDRTWTNKEGKSFAGRYIRGDGLNVWIRKSGAQEALAVPMASLVTADQAAVKELQSDFSWKLPFAHWPGAISAPATRPAFPVDPKPNEALHTFRTRGFEFKVDQPLAVQQVGEFGRTFEASIELFTHLPWEVRPAPPEGKFFQVRLFSDRTAFLKATGAVDQGSAKIAGLYKPDDRIIYVPLESLREGKSPSNGTLRHELTHQMMHDILAVMPWWVAEGTAEYVRTIPWDGRGAYSCDQVATPAVMRKMAAEGAMNELAFRELFENGLPAFPEWAVANQCAAARQFMLKQLLKIRSDRADQLAGRTPAPREEEGRATAGMKVIQQIANLEYGRRDEGKATVLKYHAAKMLVYYLQHLEGDGRGTKMLQLMWHLRQWADEYKVQRERFEVESKQFQAKFKDLETKAKDDFTKMESTYEQALLDWRRSYTGQSNNPKPVAPEEELINALPKAPDLTPFDAARRGERWTSILTKSIGDHPEKYYGEIIAAFKARKINLEILEGDPRASDSLRIK